MPEMSSISSVVLPPEGSTHDEISRLVLAAAPREVVGLLTSLGEVIELTNLSTEPHGNFVVEKGELLHHLQRLGSVDDLVLWHSHPGGGIGPSRTDLQQKIPFLHHLVVSIVDDDIVYTFY